MFVSTKTAMPPHPTGTKITGAGFDDFKPIETRNALWVSEMPETQKPLTGDKIVDAAPEPKYK